MKMGMMGGAFKRGGKDDEKGPKEDKKKVDKKRGPLKEGPHAKGGQAQPANQKTGNKQDASRARQTKSQIQVTSPDASSTRPRIQVTSPDASSTRPAIVSESRRVLPVSRMASITDQVIDRKQQRLRLHPVLPQGSRRASLPALMADPFLSPNDWRGAHAKDPALRRKSTASPYRWRSFTVVEENEFVRDPLECLLPNYENEEKLNIPPVTFSIKFSTYLDSVGIGFIVGILLALIVKGILLLVDFVALYKV